MMVALMLAHSALATEVSVYVPTPMEAVSVMIQVAEVTEEDIFYDLGCGDGRIVVSAALVYGCQVVGIDYDSDRVAETRRTAKRNGVSNLVVAIEGDVLEEDFDEATVITCYLMKDLLQLLKPKFAKLRKGTRIVCYEKPIPGVTEERKVQTKLFDGRMVTIYLYRTPLVACPGGT